MVATRSVMNGVLACEFTHVSVKHYASRRHGINRNDQRWNVILPPPSMVVGASVSGALS